MINPTITIISKSEVGYGGNNVGKGTNRKNSSIKKIGVLRRNINNASSFINKPSLLKVGSKLTSSSAGALGAVGVSLAVINLVGTTVKKGTNIYTQVKSASSGDTIKYHNLNKRTSRFWSPISTAIGDIWQYGIITPMELKRENQVVEYNRRLTGSLIDTREINKGVF